jgi:hypothetical protein
MQMAQGQVPRSMMPPPQGMLPPLSSGSAPLPGAPSQYQM